MINEINRVILIKEKLIEESNAQVIELRSKIKKSETLIKELKN
jgi:uncharacterized coiled-coil protein SlyX